MKNLFNGNLKDKLTNFASLIGVIAGVILAAPTAGVSVSLSILAAAKLGMAGSIALIGWFTGKTSDGSIKTDNQIDNSNLGK